MSETMLERVARAIMVSCGGCDVTDLGEGEWNPHVAEALAEARAAIEAMRKPTQAMIDAADRAVRPDSDNLQCPDWYTAAIDAALSAQSTGEKE